MTIKKILTIITPIVILLCTPVGALALLIPETLGGVDLVHDTESGEYWLRDTWRYNIVDYYETLSLIAADNDAALGTMNTWELASVTQVEDLVIKWCTSFDPNLFEPTESTSGGPGFSDEVWFWDNRTATTISGPDGVVTDTWNVAVMGYHQIDGSWIWETEVYPFPIDQGATERGAWVKTTTVPVPEPTTILLLGFGIAGLAGFGRKFGKNVNI